MIGRAVLAAACWLVASNAVASCDRPAPVRFAHGAASAEIAGGVPRGMRDCFTIEAQAGQRLSIAQPGHRDTNIVIQLYRPPWRVRDGEDGLDVTGRALPGAEDGADATHWSGELPATGAYLLVIGTSWGGGEYRLRIAIR